MLDLQPATGGVERLYLDAQTYLPVRRNAVLKIGTIRMPVEMYFDDWQEVDGVKYPFLISQRFPKLTLSFTVKEIKPQRPDRRRSILHRAKSTEIGPIGPVSLLAIQVVEAHA